MIERHRTRMRHSRSLPTTALALLGLSAIACGDGSRDDSGAGDTEGDAGPGSTSGDVTGGSSTTTASATDSETDSATSTGTDSTGGSTGGAAACDWERRVPNPLGDLSTYGTDVLALADGGVLGGVHTMDGPNPVTTQVAFLTRFDETGTELWSWSGTDVAPNTGLRGLVTGPNDGLVALLSTPDETEPARLAGVSGDGELQWTTATDIAPFAFARHEDELWVGGTVTGTSSVLPALTHHTLDGSLLDSLALATTSGPWEQPLAVAAGSDGVFLGGREWAQEVASSSHAGFVRGVDTSGASVWGELTEPTDGKDTEILALALFPDGDVVATGKSNLNLAGLATELHVSRWSPTGTLRWERWWSGDAVPDANVFEQGNGVAVGPRGNVWVAGSRLVALQSEDTPDMLLAAWSGDGEHIGHLTWGEPTNYSDAATAVTFDAAGQLWLAGSWGHADDPNADAWIRCTDPAAVVWE